MTREHVPIKRTPTLDDNKEVPPSPRTSLTHDICDLTAFGGSWENVLCSVWPAAIADEAIAAISGVAMSSAPSRELAEARSTVGVSFPRYLAAAFAAVPSTLRRQFADTLLVAPGRSHLERLLNNLWYPSRFVDPALRPPTDQVMSVSDLVRAGVVIGWSYDDIIDTLWSTDSIAPAALTSLDGAVSFIENDIDRILERFEALPKKTRRVPVVLVDASAEVLTPLVGPICATATSSGRGRSEAASMVKRLPTPIARIELERILSEGSVQARTMAFDLLLATQPAEMIPQVALKTAQSVAQGLAPFLKGIEFTFGTSTSGASEKRRGRSSSRTRVRMSPRDRPQPGRSTNTSRRPGSRPGGTARKPARSSGQFICPDSLSTPGAAICAIANGRKPPYVAPTQLVSFLSTPPADETWLIDRLGRVHVIRLLFHVVASRVNAASAIAPLLEKHDISPVDVMHADPGVDKQRSTWVVSRVCDESPSTWTAEQIAEWARQAEPTLLKMIANPWSDSSPLFATVAHASYASEELETILVDKALSGTKTERAALQHVSRKSFRSRVVQRLTDTKKSQRTAAAEWLRGDPQLVDVDSAVAELHVATRKERDPRARDAMISALEAYGEPIDEFLEHDEILRNAEASMRRASSRSGAIAWLDIGGLPRLLDTEGAFVERAIVESILHTAAKDKTSSPTATTRRYLASLDSRTAQAFGAQLMAEWLNRDVGGGKDMNARSSIGLFAVAAACGGRETIDLASAYVHHHRGKRKMQSKAMIDLLAEIDDPLAVQVVMGIAHRFRPKALQVHAEEAVNRIAMERGWTLEDLADRGVPDCGFDSSGKRTIDFGERSFTAAITDDLAIVLVNDETGKTTKALPRGRADEDASLIKRHRAELNASKKDLKAAAEVQPIRLRRAMAVQRTWDEADFRQFVLDHPVMMRMATRLVWLAQDDDERTLFRPLTDGTLVDLDDEEFVLSPGAIVKLAHTRLVDSEDEAAAVRHLSDYEVQPLFAQFDRPTAPLSPSGDRIMEFDGNVVTATTLANRARALGWQVGDTHSTGSSFGVAATFADLGIAAVLTTKNGLHIGGYDVPFDTTCTVDGLQFSAMPIGRFPTAIPLDRVPSTLVDEMYADALTIAVPTRIEDGA